MIKDKLSPYSSSLAFAFLLLWTLDYPILHPGLNLDSNWLVGINLGVLQDLKFGQDMIFSFGPLGYLWANALVDYHLWCISFIFNLAIHSLCLASLFFLVRREKFSVPLSIFLLVIGLLTFYISLDYKILLGGSSLLYYQLIYPYDGKRKWVIYMVVAFFFALGSLIKFNVFIIGLSYFALYSLALYVQSNPPGQCFKECGVLVGGFTFFLFQY